MKPDDTDPGLVDIRHRVMALEANTDELVRRAREHHAESATLLEAMERHALAVTELAADLQPRPNGNGAAHGDDVVTQEERGR